MDEEIKVGDWIAFKSSGLPMEGQVIEVESDSYGVRMRGGGVSTIGRDEGADIRKIPPSAGEGQ